MFLGQIRIETPGYNIPKKYLDQFGFPCSQIFCFPKAFRANPNITIPPQTDKKGRPIQTGPSQHAERPPEISFWLQDMQRKKGQVR